LAAGNYQDAKVGAQRLADPLNVPRGHLKFLARLVVEFVREKTVDAPHVANGRYQDVQEDRRERTAGCHPSVSFEDFFMMKIHTRAASITLTQFWLLELAFGA